MLARGCMHEAMQHKLNGVHAQFKPQAASTLNMRCSWCLRVIDIHLVVTSKTCHTTPNTTTFPRTTVGGKLGPANIGINRICVLPPAVPYPRVPIGAILPLVVHAMAGVSHHVRPVSLLVLPPPSRGSSRHRSLSQWHHPCAQRVQ